MIPATEPVLRGPSDAYLNCRVGRIAGVSVQEFTQDLGAVTPLVEAWCDAHGKHLEITRVPGGDCAWIVFISDRPDLNGADVVFAQEASLAKAFASVLAFADLHWPTKTLLE